MDVIRAAAGDKREILGENESAFQRGMEFGFVAAVAELTLPLQPAALPFLLFLGLDFFARPQQQQQQQRQRRERRVSQSQFAPLPLDDPFSRQALRLALVS